MYICKNPDEFVLGQTETIGEDGTIIRTVGKVRPGIRYRRRSTGAPILVWDVYKVVGRDQ